MLAFAELGLNIEQYWLNESIEDTLSVVPTSAITGEGLSDLMYYLCNMG
jgi:translation initiation factor 5B